MQNGIANESHDTILLQDFNQLLAHHVATVVLLLFCYIVSMVQLGMLILIVHDISDIPLEVSCSHSRV